MLTSHVSKSEIGLLSLRAVSPCRHVCRIGQRISVGSIFEMRSCFLGLTFRFETFMNQIKLVLQNWLARLQQLS